MTRGNIVYSRLKESLDLMEELIIL
jgi:hypothetical protein